MILFHILGQLAVIAISTIVMSFGLMIGINALMYSKWGLTAIFRGLTPKARSQLSPGAILTLSSGTYSNKEVNAELVNKALEQ